MGGKSITLIKSGATTTSSSPEQKDASTPSTSTSELLAKSNVKIIEPEKKTNKQRQQNRGIKPIRIKVNKTFSY